MGSAKDPRFLNADSEDSDQTGRTLILLVLSYRGWNELRDLTTGIYNYQLKRQVKSYAGEHFDENEQYEIMTRKEEECVLKAQIRSPQHTVYG